MTSNELKVETPFAKVTFSQEEGLEIRRITNIYSDLYKKAIDLQKEIENSEKNLVELAKEMEDLKSTEQDFFQEIATRLDLEPNTVANAAANLVLTSQI
jgi:hypothetical protein